MKEESKVQVGVKSFVFNNLGQILVLKRDPTKYPESNHPWDIPGGRIVADQTLEANLTREIEEETALRPDILELLVAQDIIKPHVRVVRLTYISHETLDETPLRLSDEHSEFKWLDIDQVLGLEGIDRYVSDILKNNVLLERIRQIIAKGIDR